MRCTNPQCNKEIPNGSKFCPHCGTQQANWSYRILIIAPKTIAFIKPKIKVYADNVFVGEVPFDSTMYYETTENRVFFRFEIYRLIGSNVKCECGWDASTGHTAIDLSFNNLLDRLTAKIY